jgi:hypothetical protein
MRAPFALARLAVFTALLIGSAFADAKPPTPLPALEGARGNLAVRIIRYTGGVNGEMVVEVQNHGSKAEVFSAQGLYFVPDGDPDKAPQRLGAAGPFQIEGQGQPRVLEKLPLAPKAKAQVRLQVFCIDSHRGSPTAQHSFHLGKERLPKQLRNEIDTKAKAALSQHGGRMPAAKAAIQSEVWQARDKKWIKLDGERKQEKGPSQMHPQSPRPIHRHPQRIQERREQAPQKAPQFAQPPPPRQTP